ncbi:MAG: hypothetical protein EOP04_17415 [Proteobacteria bacterium]|nr:MAG: hypothetical protein EOP04_17415 [Pseudomonadota bacterium]
MKRYVKEHAAAIQPALKANQAGDTKANEELQQQALIVNAVSDHLLANFHQAPLALILVVAFFCSHS